jgi:hypothetical protein
MQKFWLHKGYTGFPPPYVGGDWVEIDLPLQCPHCKRNIKIYSPGSNQSDGTLTDICAHTATYPGLWGMRIVGTPINAKASGGMQCSKCNDFNQYAQANQADGTFLCYGCRSSI